MRNEAKRASPLRAFSQKKCDPEINQGRNRVTALRSASTHASVRCFSVQLKASSLANGRQVNTIQDERQLGASDFQRILSVQRIMAGQLIRPLLKLLIPDAKARLSPVKDLDAIATPVHEHEETSR